MDAVNNEAKSESENPQIPGKPDETMREEWDIRMTDDVVVNPNVDLIDEVARSVAQFEREHFTPGAIATLEDGTEIRSIDIFRVTTIVTIAGAGTDHPRLVRADFALDLRDGLENGRWQEIGNQCMTAIRNVMDEQFARNKYGCDAQ